MCEETEVLEVDIEDYIEKGVEAKMDKSMAAALIIMIESHINRKNTTLKEALCAYKIPLEEYEKAKKLYTP